MRVGYTGNLNHQNARVWLQEMAARGVEPVAMTQERPTWDVEWAPLLVKAPPVRGLGLGRLGIARMMRTACADARIDLLHSHEVRLEAFWARSSGFHPRVVTCWGSDVLRLTEKPLGYRLQVRRALTSADAVTVGSAHLLDAAAAAGAKRAACVRVGWGVDVERFAPDPDARRRLRAEWGLEDRVVVLSTRQLHALYRVDAIVRALAIARQSVPQLALVIVADGPERQPLEQLVAELGLQDSVRFTGGVWTDEWPAMPNIHSAADMYCSVPETDGGPLSVLEAMAAELLVVASDVPVLREWVAQTGAGLLWSDRTYEGLARLLVDATRARAEMGAAGRAYVLANHRRETEMDRVRELYDALVRRPH